MTILGIIILVLAAIGALLLFLVWRASRDTTNPDDWGVVFLFFPAMGFICAAALLLVAAIIIKVFWG